MGLRAEIEEVSALVGKTGVKRRSTSSMMQMSMNTVRLRSKQNKLRQEANQTVIDDKNSRGEVTGRKRITSSSMNDKN